MSLEEGSVGAEDRGTRLKMTRQKEKKLELTVV